MEKTLISSKKPERSASDLDKNKQMRTLSGKRENTHCFERIFLGLTPFQEKTCKGFLAKGSKEGRNEVPFHIMCKTYLRVIHSTEKMWMITVMNVLRDTYLKGVLLLELIIVSQELSSSQLLIESLKCFRTTQSRYTITP